MVDFNDPNNVDLIIEQADEIFLRAEKAAKLRYTAKTGFSGGDFDQVSIEDGVLNAQFTRYCCGDSETSTMYISADDLTDEGIQWLETQAKEAEEKRQRAARVRVLEEQRRIEREERIQLTRLQKKYGFTSVGD